MASIKCCKLLHPETLAGSDDRGIHHAEGEVAVLLEQFGDSRPVGGLSPAG